jgi:hypothetical protein
VAVEGGDLAIDFAEGALGVLDRSMKNDEVDVATVEAEEP